MAELEIRQIDFGSLTNFADQVSSITAPGNLSIAHSLVETFDPASMDADLKPLDENLDQVVSQYSLNDPGFYPLNFEYLLASGLMVLERCLSYRADVKEFESRYYAQVLEQMSLRSRLEANNVRVTIAENALQIARKRVEANRNSNSFISDEIEKLKNELVSVGSQDAALRIQIESTIRSHSAQLAQNSVNAEILALESSARESDGKLGILLGSIDEARFKFVEEHRRSYGSAVNYVDRIDRLRNLFLMDFKNAYRKLRLASVGIGAIWPELGNSNSFPTASPKGYLDSLLDWGKRTVYDLEERSKDDGEYSVVYSLRYGIGSPMPAHVAVEDAMNILKNGGIAPIVLKPEYFVGKYVRFRGVRVWPVIKQRIDEYTEKESDRVTRWNISLSVPPQHVGGGLLKFPDIHIGSAGPMQETENGGEFFGGFAMNCDPTSGPWEMKVNSTAGSLDFSDTIIDFMIEMRVAATMS